MSQVLRAANLVRELEPKDFRVLKGIELGMRRFRYVPVFQIKFYARLPLSETQFRINKLHKAGILQRNSEHNYIGYQLIMESYDVLALKSLVDKDIIVSVGGELGRGKESDVYFAMTPSGEKVALKIHRIGQNSFRKARNLRSYVENRKHISWLYISRLSAESEFKALERIKDLEYGFPEPVGLNRHMVVMGLIDGVEMSQIRNLPHPEDTLDLILRQTEELFVKGHLIHCDLSEFNIVMNDKEEILIIDYPQWEPSDHPNADFYIRRDLNNLNTYFKKNYRIEFDVDDFIKELFAQL